MYIGVEGGGTKSTALILDNDGHVLHEIMGPPLNILSVGFEESFNRISQLIVRLGYSDIYGIGLALSGADSEAIQNQFRAFLHSRNSELFKSVVIVGDYTGSVATAFGSEGGVCLIAGTGSSCCYVDKTGKTTRCGGRGHMITGDQGSAYWIASRALAKCCMARDGFATKHNLQLTWKLAKDFYFITECEELFQTFYTDYSVSKIASFAAVLAKECRESNDPFLTELFYKAGQWLGRHLVAISKNINGDTLQVAAVGSVWKSFDLLQNGFRESIEVLRSQFKEIVLYKITVYSAKGAAYLSSLETENTVQFSPETHRQLLKRYVFS